MDRLQTQNDYKITEVQFLKDAAQEVIEAHRVLRWTYVFGYFLEEPHEKSLFEFLQEDLEKNCDHLHELIEQPLTRFFGCDQVRNCVLTSVPGTWRLSRNESMSLFRRPLANSFTNTVQKSQTTLP